MSIDESSRLESNARQQEWFENACAVKDKGVHEFRMYKVAIVHVFSILSFMQCCKTVSSVLSHTHIHMYISVIPVLDLPPPGHAQVHICRIPVTLPASPTWRPQNHQLSREYRPQHT